MKHENIEHKSNRHTHMPEPKMWPQDRKAWRERQVGGGSGFFG